MFSKKPLEFVAAGPLVHLRANKNVTQRHCTSNGFYRAPSRCLMLAGVFFLCCLIINGDLGKIWRFFSFLSHKTRLERPIHETYKILLASDSLEGYVASPGRPGMGLI